MSDTVTDALPRDALRYDALPVARSADDDLPHAAVPARASGRLGGAADQVRIAGDLLTLWDLGVVALAGYGCIFAAQAAGVAAAFWTHHAFPWPGGALWHMPGPLIAALVTPLVLRAPGPAHVLEASRWQPVLERRALVVRLALLFAAILVLGWLTTLPLGMDWPWLGVWYGASLGGALIGRTALARYVDTRQERVAIIGADAHARDVWRLMRQPRAHGPGICVVGLFDDRAAVPPALGAPVLAPLSGTIADLLDRGKHRPVDKVIIAVAAPAPRQLRRLVQRLKALDAELVVCPQRVRPSLSRAGWPAHPVGQLGAWPLWCVAARPIRGWGVVAKTVEDKLLASILLIPALPLMALCALAVRLESRGPVIFRQPRHGRNNCEFEVYKFRTMVWRGRANGTGADQTARGDTRITKVGNFLRKTSLDELPQLFNVLRGEMSLVGPRALPVAMLTHGRLNHEIVAEYAHRHRVKPGITGLAQIHGNRGVTEHPWQLRERIKYDLAYIDQWSPWLDLRILFLTPWRLVVDRDKAF